MTLPQVLATVPGMRAAELEIDGLAVLRFNPSENFWEVAYPRAVQHELKITIQELDADDQPVGEQQEVEVHRSVTTIGISLSEGSMAHYTQFPEGGPKTKPFDRDAPNNDPHDLSWLIDLADEDDELGHRPVTLLGSNPSRPISLARIHHSLFCTLKPEEKPVVIAPREADDPMAGEELGPHQH